MADFTSLPEQDISNVEALVRYMGAHGGRSPEHDNPLAWWLAEAMEELTNSHPLRVLLGCVPVRPKARTITPKRAGTWERFCSRLDRLDALHRTGRTAAEDPALMDSWGHGVLTRYLNGQVTPLERLLLDRRPAWNWDIPLPEHKLKGVRFTACLNAVKTFHHEHGHTHLPDGMNVMGEDLRAWWAAQRQRYSTNTMKKDQRLRLEALKVDLRSDKELAKADPAFRYREDLIGLSLYIAAHGQSSLPARGNRIANLARTWVREYHNGTLAEALVNALEAIPGWSWEFEADLVSISSYARTYGHLDIPRDHVDGDEPVGADLHALRVEWWNNQKGLSGPARRTMRNLEEIRSEAWRRGVEELTAWYADHTAPPEPDQVTASGFHVGAFEEWARGQVDGAALTWSQLTDLTRATASAEWKERDAAAFKQAMRALTIFANSRQHVHPSWGQSEVKGVDLIAFLNRLDADHEAGELGPAEVMRLEALPGWGWSRFQRARSKQAAQLRARYARRPKEGPRRSVRTDLADPNSQLAQRGARQFLPDA